MKALLREDTPYALRIVVAAGAFALAIIGWLAIINGSRAITLTSCALGVIVLLAAFLALGVLGTHRFPLLPFWASLGISVVWSSLMMWSIAAPPHRGSVALLGAILVIALAAGIAVTRRMVGARALLVMLALLGIYGLVAVPVAVWNGGGPAISGTGAPIAVLGAACLAAIWHARSVRRDMRVVTAE